MEKETSDLSWFKKLQKNSWNPEVIISGLTLAFILAFPRDLYEFAAKIIQDWGVNYIGGLLTLMYSSFLLNVFTIFLITHLALRFIWTGLLGVSYAFPQGVIDENLPKTLKGITFGDLNEWTMKLERICSLFFGIPVYLAFIFIPITLFLLLLLAVYRIFDISFFIVYLIFMFSLFGIALTQFFYKKFYKGTPKARNLFSTMGATYISNLGKWKFQVYQILIMMIAIPLVMKDTQNFTMFFQEVSLNDNQLAWPQKNWYFEDQRDPSLRFGRILLPSDKVSGDHLPLRVAYYGEDEKYLELLNGPFSTTLDTLSWQKLSIAPDLYRISIDDSVYQISTWNNVVLDKSNQRVYETYIPIADLSDGFHEINVEKLVMRMEFFSDTEPKLRKNWANVVFFKE
jgi:hypothetical protein